MLIGAGVGAVSSAAMGKNPFTGALLGGATGGAFGGAGGFGSGFTEGNLLSGFTGVEAAVPSFATGGYANLGANAIAPTVTEAATQAATASTLPFSSTEFIGMGNPEGILPYTPNAVDSLSNINSYGSSMGSPYTPEVVYNSQFAGPVNPNFTPSASLLGKSAGYTGGGYNPSFFGRVGDMIGNPLSSLSTSDKVGLGLKGLDIAMRPEERVPPPQVNPIIQGNPALVSTPLYNVAPNVGRQEGNDRSLPNLLSTMPLSEEELLRLQQRMQTTGFRGR